MRFFLCVLALVAVIDTNYGATLAPPEAAEAAPEFVLKHDVLCDYCTGPVCRSKTNDCRVYITCEKAGSIPRPDGSLSAIYTATTSKCAFGTFFDEASGVCDTPQNVKCPTDRCTTETNLVSYEHELDTNCRTYYACNEQRISTPTCCPVGNRYDAQAGGCVSDPSCTPGCPTKADACSTPGAVKALSDDDNCRTYWDCKEGGSPHPVCCKPNEVFDADLGDCTKDTTSCTDVCPKSYETRCSEPGITAFKLAGDSCRTFVKCGANGEQATRSCCKSGYKFDAATQNCVKIDYLNEVIDCSDDCPFGYAEECHLKPVDGVIDAYFEKVGDTDEIRQCAPGAVFSTKKCGCGDLVKDPADNSCNLALNIVMDFPNTKRTGEQRMTSLSSVGKLGKGSEYLQSVSFAFDGNYGIGLEITKMRMQQAFLSVQFKPGQSQGRTTLVSNCRQQNSPNPTFDVSLEGGDCIVTIETDQGIASASVPVLPNEWNSLYIGYDGTKLDVLSKNALSTPSSSVEITGQIKMGLYALQLGKCQNSQGFVGEVHSLAWSSCLRESFFPTEIPALV